MDAIDAVIVDMEAASLEVIAYQQYPISEDIRRRVRAVDLTTSLLEIAVLDNMLGRAFARAVRQLLHTSDINHAEVRAIGSHGQTVLHLPDKDPPCTLQIGDANIICQHTGITTVTDFRRADMVVSGQGAPLAPAFHAWYFKHAGQNTLVMNLGGIANITRLHPEHISGFDTGPGNGLMDQWIQNRRGLEFDENGAWAATGHCHTALLQQMLAHPYFALPPPKSTGKDSFNLRWLEALLGQLPDRPADKDIQATLLALSIQSIADAINQHTPATEEIIICGGGLHNAALINGLQQHLAGVKLCSSAKYGLDPDAVEAVAFAWLARQRLEVQPGTLPSVTGATKAVIAGAVYQP